MIDLWAFENELDESEIEETEQLVDKNSFETPLDRKTAEAWVKHAIRLSLDVYGGYPIYDELSFSVNGQKYTIIAYGASEENEGSGALMGMLFIKEND